MRHGRTSDAPRFARPLSGGLSRRRLDCRAAFLLVKYQRIENPDIGFIFIAPANGA
jgi:hypothetical protein